MKLRCRICKMSCLVLGIIKNGIWKFCLVWLWHKCVSRWFFVTAKTLHNFLTNIIALSPCAKLTKQIKHTLYLWQGAQLSQSFDSIEELVIEVNTNLYKLKINVNVCFYFSNRFEVMFGPSYDGIVVHSFKNKVGEYLERMARYYR